MEGWTRFMTSESEESEVRASGLEALMQDGVISSCCHLCVLSSVYPDKSFCRVKLPRDIAEFGGSLYETEVKRL